MRRVVRHVRSLFSLGCVFTVATLAIGGRANAQTFTINVVGVFDSYGRGTVRSSPEGIDCTFVGTRSLHVAPERVPPASPPERPLFCP